MALLGACAAEAGLYTEDTELYSFPEDAYFLEEFSAEKIVGEPVVFGAIETAGQAAKCAELVWFEVYGKQILQQRPYIIQLDEQKGVWRVSGNPAHLDGVVGGVAEAYIVKDDGELLAVLHGKCEVAGTPNMEHPRIMVRG